MPLILSMCMFFLSFTPLWISVLFIDAMSIYEGGSSLQTELISIIVITVLTTFSMVILFRQFRTDKRAGIQKFRIDNVVEEKTITSEYLLAYILPLFAFDFTLWTQMVLFLIYFLTLAFLCIKHNHLSVNIVLELFGYRFYNCNLINEDEVPVSKQIISREKLTNHKTQIVSVKPINNEYSLDLMDWPVKAPSE